MLECYTGTGDNKVVRFRTKDYNAAQIFVWNLRGENMKGPHAGIMRDGKVVFSTDLDDPEYTAYRKEAA